MRFPSDVTPPQAAVFPVLHDTVNPKVNNPDKTHSGCPFTPTTSLLPTARTPEHLNKDDFHVAKLLSNLNPFPNHRTQSLLSSFDWNEALKTAAPTRESHPYYVVAFRSVRKLSADTPGLYDGWFPFFHLVEGFSDTTSTLEQLTG
jgi:hypothetical protein